MKLPSRTDLPESAPQHNALTTHSRRVLTVPKEAILKEEARLKAERAKKEAAKRTAVMLAAGFLKILRYATVLFGLCAAAPADPPLNWHEANVVSVRAEARFYFFDVIDSRDPSCALTLRTSRDRSKPANIRVGSTATIAEGKGRSVYLKDADGRIHKGTIIRQSFLPPLPPPPKQ